MASIRPRRRADGSTVYQLIWRTPAHHQTSATYAARVDAERARDHLERYGYLPPDDPHAATGPGTVAALLAHHIDHLTGVEERTRQAYRRMAQTRITPMLGAIPADQLTRSDVARWVNTLARDLSGKTVANYHALLSHALTVGIRDGWLTRNVATGVTIGRGGEHDRPDMRLLTPGELDDLVTALDAHWRPLVVFLAGTGCRFGEAIALTVGDVDLSVPQARIVKAVKRRGDSSGVYVGPTKTRRSRRTIVLPAQLVPLLAPLVRGRGKRELLFTTPAGALVDHAHFYERQWRPAVRAAGVVPPPRIHDLRHFHASRLLAEGQPLPVVQRRLGHESITTTVDTYGHLLPDAQAAAARAAALSLPDLAALEGPR